MTHGIDICLNGKSLKLFFAMSHLAGDNEGLNSVMGFTEGFNANYYCRLCLVRKSDAQRNVPLNQSLQRTQEQYEEHGFKILKKQE